MAPAAPTVVIMIYDRYTINHSKSCVTEGRSFHSRCRHGGRDHSVPGEKVASGALVSRGCRRGRIGTPLEPGEL